MKRSIVHVDMDAFFASIEQRDDPRLRSKPVIVGADPKAGKGRGVVSTCSYEARRFGIHSAMPISVAYRKCPDAFFLGVDMPKYEAVSGRLHAILNDFTPDIEPVSIDEAFLDISGSYHLFGTRLDACKKIKAAIKDRIGLTASLGIAPTKMAAKIASDLGKPDGLIEVTAKGLSGFLRPLEIRRLWGLGEKSEAALRRIGIQTIGQLADADLATISGLLGRPGTHFRELARGIDDRPVEPAGEAKSVSNEITFDKDAGDNGLVKTAVMSLCEKVSSRLRQEGLKCRTVTLKVRLSDFDTYTRAATIGSATNFIETLYNTAVGLYNTFDPRGKKIRLIGVKASRLSSAKVKDDLFAPSGSEKLEAAHAAVDKIKKRFGYGAIYRSRLKSCG